MTSVSQTRVSAGCPRPRAGQILQVGALMPALATSLADDYGAVFLPDGTERAAFLREHGGDVTVVVTSGKGGVDRSLLAQLPRLAAIIHFGVGYDKTDVPAARARGVAVSNTPDVLTDCVADTAVALLLDVFRGTSAADRFVRRGDWEDHPYPLTRKFSGSRIGILGLGRIGAAIAERLRAFGCEVSYHNRRERPEVPYEYLDSPLELARRNDALVVAAAGGPQSAGLVGREVIAALGPAGYLVNVARGSVVDEPALIEALQQGTIAGAGLDVYADEPHVPAALRALDTAVLLPHLASGTVETRQAMADLVLANLRQFLTTGTLISPVT